MVTNKMIVQSTGITVLAGALLLTGCAGGPLSTREKGAGIGALGGAATGWYHRLGGGSSSCWSGHRRRARLRRRSFGRRPIAGA